jgi:hypothetical protein
MARKTRSESGIPRHSRLRSGRIACERLEVGEALRLGIEDDAARELGLAPALAPFAMIAG